MVLVAKELNAETLLERTDLVRLDASRRQEEGRREEMGQFLTPAPVAGLMASMFRATRPRSIRLLDAGAGVGSLSAAFVAKLCRPGKRPRDLTVIAYEVDPLLSEYLGETLDACRIVCERVGITFSGEVRQEDFVEAGISMLNSHLFSKHEYERFNCAILNPPYRKIHSESNERRLLRSIGVETVNLYTGFLSIAVKLLVKGGELVAITPRSFCNGPYYKPFRQLFLDLMTFRRIHVFESRSRAFQEDNVLQENIIFHAIKGINRSGKVVVSSNEGPSDEYIAVRRVTQGELVSPGDPDFFIRLVTDDVDHRITEKMRRLEHSIEDVGLSVSTGRVVDFRAQKFLRDRPGKGAAPLIYPTHFKEGFVSWPNTSGRKPNALLVAPETKNLLVPNGAYVLAKRFSAKEERRRVVAAVYDPNRIPASRVGFENHLNYYHHNGSGLPLTLAKGLTAFLNSTLVDSYFRQFSGHTQVNATDLRSFKYPSRAQLEALGSKIGKKFPNQDELDRLIEEELTPMADDDLDPIQAKKKIDEALGILKTLGFPREQQNERSALTLLSLLDLKPETRWAEARDPLRGITEMMEYIRKYFGKNYAPNTRETIRRQTVHQFVQAGLLVPNPDRPSRPTNSPKTVYQVEPGVLGLLRAYETGQWTDKLKIYLRSVETLKKRYARERKMRRIPVQVSPGKNITLSPGGQNILVKMILDEFCSRFTPGAKVIYVGDTGEKFAYFDPRMLAGLGVTIEQHGKMPDVVVYHEAKGWLVLIEAVTSHGPVNPKRQLELKELFKGSRVGLVFVTTFLDRKSLVKYLSDIAWETEIWVAENPTHLIHFNGERFLGPYETPSDAV